MAFVELLQFLIVCEKRSQTHYLRALHIAQVLQARDDGRKLLDVRVFCTSTCDSATARNEKMRVIRHDNVIFIQFERVVEALA